MLNCVRNTELTVLKYGQLDNVNLRPTSYFISSQKKNIMSLLWINCQTKIHLKLENEGTLAESLFC